MAKLLIEKGIDITVKNKERKTPLFNPYLKAPAIKVLIEAGVDVSVKDKKMKLFFLLHESRNCQTIHRCRN